MVYRKYIFALCLTFAGFLGLSAMDEDRQKRSDDYPGNMFFVAEDAEEFFDEDVLSEEDDEDRKSSSFQSLASGWQKIEGGEGAY